MARAQSDNSPMAEALFEKGKLALEQRDYRTACAAFEESNRLEPAPGTLGNLALCEEQSGHLASAWEHYKETVARLPATDSRRAIAAERAAALKARLPLLTIRFASDVPSNAIVARDSVELGAASLGTPLPIDPGVHRVTVAAPGRAQRSYEIELREKETRELVVQVGAAEGDAESAGLARTEAGPEPHQPREEAPSSSQRTVGYVVGGIGVVGIGTALVFGGLALGKKSTVADQCDTKDHLCDAQSGVDAASAGRKLSTISTVRFVVGALATGAGAYLILSADRSGPRVGLTAFPNGVAASVAGYL